MANRTKVHYRAEVSDEIVERNRVAATCGAITVHADPQPLVRETSNRSLVTCGNCLRWLRKNS